MAASRSGSSSSSSGPCSSSSRSYRVRRAASPRASASATSRKSCARKRPRTLARIMPKPPSSAATPRPAPELLARLTTLAQELAGAFRPATVIELVARALAELLKPDRLSGILLDAESNPLAVTYDTHPGPAPTARAATRVFADLIQLAVTAIPGRPWLGLLPPAWSDPVARAIAEPSASTAEIRAGERVLLLTAIPMAEPGSAVLVFEDQTDRRRLQEQLIQSEKMSAIGQLIAGVAHDLNNPLASVVGFSDFLAEAGDVPPSLVEPLQRSRQEAQRAR